MRDLSPVGTHKGHPYGDFGVTALGVTRIRHSERSEESKTLGVIRHCFVGECFGFFTPLRSVQNDSWRMSLGPPAPAPGGWIPNRGLE